MGMEARKGAGDGARRSVEEVSPRVAAIIDEAVRKAVDATRAARADETRGCYRQTERRLYALPHLQEKAKDDAERLAGLMEGGTQRRSQSIVRFSASGIRADPEEMEDAVRQDLIAHMARDQHEIDVLEGALAGVEGDAYYRTVPGKYFEGKPDWEMAEELCCDESTVRRNRARLVRIVAIRLYGVDAMG